MEETAIYHIKAYFLTINMSCNIPFFSIIIPTFNRNDIDTSINSVLNQTFQDFEIIVVDDHSDIPAIKRCTILQNPRIHFFYSDVNRGAAGARNYGATQAHGKYLAFIDDDDEWFPEKLQVLYNAINQKSPDLIYHNVTVEMINEHLSYIPHKQQEKNYYPKMLYTNCIGGTPMVAIKTTFFNKMHGFNESLRSDEDGELFIRIAKHTNNIIYINQVLGKFNNYTKKGSVTKALQNRIDSRFQIYDIYKDDINTLLTSSQKKQMFEFMYSDFALAALLNYDKKNACKYYLKTFTIRFNPKYLILAILSLISVKSIFYLRTKI